MFNFCKDKSQYEPEKYKKIIRNNVAFVNDIDNILQKTQRKRNHRNANVSNVIKSKLDTMILLLDKLNTNNNIITSLINKYSYQSKLKCDRTKKYLENKQKQNNSSVTKVIRNANRINKSKSKSKSKSKCKRGRLIKTISINMQQTKKHGFENEDKNGTENENILDFLYCYNYNQNLLFD